MPKTKPLKYAVGQPGTISDPAMQKEVLEEAARKLADRFMRKGITTDSTTLLPFGQIVSWVDNEKAHGIKNCPADDDDE